MKWLSLILITMMFSASTYAANLGATARTSDTYRYDGTNTITGPALEINALSGNTIHVVASGGVPYDTTTLLAVKGPQSNDFLLLFRIPGNDYYTSVQSFYIYEQLQFNVVKLASDTYRHEGNVFYSGVAIAIDTRGRSGTILVTADGGATYNTDYLLALADSSQQNIFYMFKIPGNDYYTSAISFSLGTQSSPITADIKANGKDSPDPVTYGSTFTASWTSNADSCTTYGSYVMLPDGRNWIDISSVPTSGSMTLVATDKDTGYKTPLALGIQCWKNGQAVTDTVLVPVTQQSQSAKPDYIIYQFEIPQFGNKLVLNTPTQLGMYIKNAGGAASSSSYVSLRVPSDFGGNGEQSIRALSAGEDYVVRNFAVTCTKLGSFIITGKADINNNIDESNENNNEFSATVECVSSTPTPGTSYEVKSCQALSQAGTYYLQNDISGVSGTCFTIIGNDITLDCQTHSVTGNNNMNTFGVDTNGYGGSGVKVKNCRFRNFDTAIRFASEVNGEIFQNQLVGAIGPGLSLAQSQGIDVHDNGISTTCSGCFALDLFYSGYNSIHDNTIDTSTSSGMAVVGDSNKVTGNTIDAANLGLGVWTSASGNLITGNKISATGSNGIGISMGAHDNTVTGNTVSSKSGAAISISKDSASNQAYQNSLTGSIWVENYASNTFDSGSKGNTYYLADGTPSWKKFDIIDSNGDHYADAGKNLPFGSSTVGGYWLGNGQDNHPYTEKVPVPTPSTIKLFTGWNMVSVPVQNSVSISQFVSKCGALPYAWAYSNGYVQATTLSPGMGYWVKAAKNCEVQVSGNKFNGQTALSAGWNMVGSPGDEVSIQEYQGNCAVISGPWYYDLVSKTYVQSATFAPGKAYWLKVSAACTLNNLNMPPAAPV